MRDEGLEFLLKSAATAAACTSVEAWWPRQAALCALHRYIKPFRTMEDLHVHASVASSAREKRLARAWERIDAEASGHAGNQ